MTATPLTDAGAAQLSPERLDEIRQHDPVSLAPCPVCGGARVARSVYGPGGRSMAWVCLAMSCPLRPFALAAVPPAPDEDGRDDHSGETGG